MKIPSTPSTVMFETLKTLGINNKAVAPILLRHDIRIGGLTPAEHANEATYLHLLTRTRPDEVDAGQFADLTQSSQTLCERALKKGKVKSADELVAFLCGEPTQQMVDMLNAYDLDGTVFATLMAKAAATQNATKTDVASLCMLTFVATGCLQNMSAVVDLCRQFSKSIASKTYGTELPGTIPVTAKSVAQPTKLGLVRLEGNALDLSNVKPLSTDPQGTILGKLATGPSTITNLGAYCSGEHLRVFCDNAGRWYAQGLGSTNGTTLIRGDTKEEVVVEPPRSQRTAPSEPVQINVSDALCLAGTTVFMVVVVK